MVLGNEFTLPGVGMLMNVWMYTFVKVAIRNWQSNLRRTLQSRIFQFVFF